MRCRINLRRTGKDFPFPSCEFPILFDVNTIEQARATAAEKIEQERCRSPDSEIEVIGDEIIMAIPINL